MKRAGAALVRTITSIIYRQEWVLGKTLFCQHHHNHCHRQHCTGEALLQEVRSSEN